MLAAAHHSVWKKALPVHAPPGAERNQKKEAKEHKKRNRVKARKNKRIFAFTWLAMVILVSLTLASYLIGGSNDFLGVDRMDSEVEVTIPENVTQEQLTDILYKSHAIDKPEFFSLFCKFTTEMEYFEPGTYTIKTNYDYKQLVNTLQSGPDLGEEITVMFREGITVPAACRFAGRKRPAHCRRDP